MADVGSLTKYSRVATNIGSIMEVAYIPTSEEEYGKLARAYSTAQYLTNCVIRHYNLEP